MGHPDKVADQISDAVLDSILTHDPKARVACETLVTTGLVVIAGEATVHNNKALAALSDAEQTARDTIKEIGYVDPEIGFDYRSCAVIRTIHAQSADINQGVDRGDADEQGAGDQGLMFGYANDETPELMPFPIHLSHRLVERLAEVRQRGELPWVRPDGKSQVTVEYDASGRPKRVHTVVLSTQHEESVCDKKGNLSSKATNEITERVIKPVIPKRMLDADTIYHVNPTGRFVVGGPHGDTGLTGRKIIVDTYGGRGCHGGGAFSGKDPSKVDRSASYMARYIAKNIVAAKLAQSCEVQLSYAIGVADPISVLIDTDGTGTVDDDALANLVREHFPLRPGGIIKHLKLLRPIYKETARHGHFGRPDKAFTWEKTDKAEALARAAKGV